MPPLPLTAGGYWGLPVSREAGQRELWSPLPDWKPMTGGTITYYPPEGGESSCPGMSAPAINKLGIKLSFVPEDRLGTGLVGAMDMTDNMMLKGYPRGRSFFTDRKTPKTWRSRSRGAGNRDPGVATPVRKLSGEMSRRCWWKGRFLPIPRCLWWPIRSADWISTHPTPSIISPMSRRTGSGRCMRGGTWMCFWSLRDRILVLCAGHVNEVWTAGTATKEQVGLMMTRTGGGLSERR